MPHKKSRRYKFFPLGASTNHGNTNNVTAASSIHSSSRLSETSKYQIQHDELIANPHSSASLLHKIQTNPPPFDILSREIPQTNPEIWLLFWAHKLVDFIQKSLPIQIYQDPIMTQLTPLELAQHYAPPYCTIGTNTYALCTHWNTIIQNFVMQYNNTNAQDIIPVFVLRITWVLDIIFNSFSLIRIIPVYDDTQLEIILKNPPIEFSLFRLMEMLQMPKTETQPDIESGVEIALRRLLRLYGTNIVTSQSPRQYQAGFIDQILKAGGSDNLLALTSIHAFDKRYGFPQKCDNWQVQFLSPLNFIDTLNYINVYIKPAVDWQMQIITKPFQFAGQCYGTRFLINSIEDDTATNETLIQHRARTTIYSLSSYIPIPFMKDGMAHDYINYFILLYNICSKKKHITEALPYNYSPIIWRCLYFMLDHPLTSATTQYVVGPVKPFADFLKPPRIIRSKLIPSTLVSPPTLSSLGTTSSFVGRGLLLKDAIKNSIVYQSTSSDITPQMGGTAMYFDLPVSSFAEEDTEDISNALSNLHIDQSTLNDLDYVEHLNGTELMMLEHNLMDASYRQRADLMNTDVNELVSLEHEIRAITQTNIKFPYDRESNNELI